MSLHCLYRAGHSPSKQGTDASRGVAQMKQPIAEQLDDSGLSYLSSVSAKTKRSISYVNGIQPFLFAYPQVQFLFNCVPPKLLVYNSSYTQSVLYIYNTALITKLYTSRALRGTLHQVADHSLCVSATIAADSSLHCSRTAAMKTCGRMEV